MIARATITVGARITRRHARASVAGMPAFEFRLRAQHAMQHDHTVLCCVCRAGERAAADRATQHGRVGRYVRHSHMPFFRTFINKTPISLVFCISKTVDFAQHARVQPAAPGTASSAGASMTAAAAVAAMANASSSSSSSTAAATASPSAKPHGRAPKPKSALRVYFVLFCFVEMFVAPKY